tara:strand:- start:1772 stop:1945 length:174 start_codon:yes stop_codon:yes gene_type:complete
MLEQKAHHKELKRAVNEVEDKRRNDRTFKSWFDLRTLKKIKLQAKDKLNEIKQKLQP